MVRTRGGPSCKPRVCRFSLPLLLGRPILLLQPLLYLHPLPLFLLLLHLTGMIHGSDLLCHLLLIRDHPRGPRPLAQGSLPVPGPRSPLHHLTKALLEISLWIYPLLRSSGDLSSTEALLPKIPIAVLGTCIVRYIMIFRPLLKIQSSVTLCG